ncbi:hypothetical protein [Stenotrophomonas phage SOVA965]
METRIRGMEQSVRDIKDSLERIAGGRDASQNVNTIKIEGMGSMWHGLAIGVALGAVVIGGAWIVSTQQRLEATAQQSEAYAKAVYMLAPRFAEEIDKELSRQKEE